MLNMSCGCITFWSIQATFGGEILCQSIQQDDSRMKLLPFDSAFIVDEATRRLSAPDSRLILRTSNQQPALRQPWAWCPCCCVIRQAQGPPVALADSTPLQWGLPLSQSQPWPWIPVHLCTHKQSLPIHSHVHTHSQTSGVVEAGAGGMGRGGGTWG